MSFMRTLALSTGLATFFFILSGMVLPATFRVERTATIQAPADTVFAQIADLRKTESWNPFIAEDPTTVVTYSEITSGVGAEYGWLGDDTGKGSMRITAVEPGGRVRAHLFFGNAGSQADADWLLTTDDGEVTTVRWAMWGEETFPVVGPYQAMFMDYFLGSRFDLGLERLSDAAVKAEAATKERARLATEARAAAEAERAAKAASEAAAAFALPALQTGAMPAAPGAAPAVPGAPAAPSAPAVPAAGAPAPPKAP